MSYIKAIFWQIELTVPKDRAHEVEEFFLRSGAQSTFELLYAEGQTQEQGAGEKVFDLPGLRSAFGIAGTGTAAPTDEELAQWPLHLAWPGGRAGYGLSGRKPYVPDDPDGAGQESLAYLRIDGQGCLYNVWSRLGRAHLELLLRGLRPLAAP